MSARRVTGAFERGLQRSQLYAELADAFEPLGESTNMRPADGWRVFFKTPRFRADAAHQLATAFGNHVLDLSPVDVDDEDWARRSQADLKAIHVGRITVAPPWDSLPLPARRCPRPSNHHRAVDGIWDRAPRDDAALSQFLQDVEVTARRVIDVGTGSGVLAIAARMLGAASVVAVDNDPDALQNARENAARNGVRCRDRGSGAGRLAPRTRGCRRR